ncbi:MAG TPA: PQQ-binding-like beta-propeller repeat protein, partial [Bacteroidales bacterium]|nr:PQQ-binding-like beta-propeller repeat protein [Bacteroidales bacterium]
LSLNVFGGAATGTRLVYFGSLDGKIYALNLSNGNIQWSFQTKASKKNWPQVFDHNNQLRKDLIQNANGSAQKVYKKIHSLGSILSTPVLHEGKLYFGSMDGKIYCLY